jgi:acetyltransferase-like isoleucine patch superfamily enzyme
MKRLGIPFNPNIYEFLKVCNVYLTRNKNGKVRFKDGDIISFYDKTTIGLGYGFYNGGLLPISAGHYSFSHSAFIDPVTIGNYTSIGEDVSVFGFEHPTNLITTSPILYDQHLPLFASADTSSITAVQRPDHPITHIGHDVWIGRGALIKSGVTVGTGAVVGAGSIVTRDVEPYTVVAGSPASIIRTRFSESLIEKLLKSEWWDHNSSLLAGQDPKNVDAIVQQVNEKKSANSLLPPLRNFLTIVQEFDN